MPNNTKRKLQHPPVVSSICCNCRKLKLSNIFNPQPKTKPPHYQKPNNHQPSMSSWQSDALSIATNDDDSTTFSSNGTSSRGSGRVVGESMAVVKDSYDPYMDFRHSMLQMIVEKEIYAQDDLKELLQCFLSLNSPSHHQIIVQAFSEIWNGVFFAPKMLAWRRSRESLGSALGKARVGEGERPGCRL